MRLKVCCEKRAAATGYLRYDRYHVGEGAARKLLESMDREGNRLMFWKRTMFWKRSP